MGFLAGKRILVTGVLSNRSIAYGIARACHQQGAELAFTYVGDRFKERVAEFAAEFGSKIVLPCDVAEDSQIEATFAELGAHWDGLDGLVHSIGFAPREAIAGDFLDGLSREAFRVAHDISAYSFPAMAKAALPLMQGRNASVLTLTYLGAERVVPNYNTMGLAKASLEASVRYLATALGRAASAPTASRPARSRPWPPAASGLLGHPEVRRGPGAAAPQRHHRGRGQRRRLPAVGPGRRRDR